MQRKAHYIVMAAAILVLLLVMACRQMGIEFFPYDYGSSQPAKLKMKNEYQLELNNDGVNVHKKIPLMLQ